MRHFSQGVKAPDKLERGASRFTKQHTGSGSTHLGRSISQSARGPPILLSKGQIRRLLRESNHHEFALPHFVPSASMRFLA